MKLRSNLEIEKEKELKEGKGRERENKKVRKKSEVKESIIQTLINEHEA